MTRGFEFQIANDFSACGIANESIDADPDARDARLKEPGGRQAGAWGGLKGSLEFSARVVLLIPSWDAEIGRPSALHCNLRRVADWA